jgi:hypothetical protein
MALLHPNRLASRQPEFLAQHSVLAFLGKIICNFMHDFHAEGSAGGWPVAALRWLAAGEPAQPGAPIRQGRASRGPARLGRAGPVEARPGGAVPGQSRPGPVAPSRGS